MSWSNLPPEVWLFLRVLCDGRGRRLDSAGALAHARTCGACTAEVARLTGRRVLERAA